MQLYSCKQLAQHYIPFKFQPSILFTLGNSHPQEIIVQFQKPTSLIRQASYLTGRNRRIENMSSQFLAFPASNPQTRIPSIMCMPTYSWKRPAHRHPGYWFVVDVTESWWHDDHRCLMCTAPIQPIQASASSKLCQPANLSYLSHIANKPVSESRKCHRSIPR